MEFIDPVPLFLKIISEPSLKATFTSPPEPGRSNEWKLIPYSQQSRHSLAPCVLKTEKPLLIPQELLPHWDYISHKWYSRGNRTSPLVHIFHPPIPSPPAKKKGNAACGSPRATNCCRVKISGIFTVNHMLKPVMLQNCLQAGLVNDRQAHLLSKPACSEVEISV